MSFLKKSVLLSIILVLLSSFTIQPDADGYLQSGIKFCEQKEYIKAIGDFTMAISLRPDFGSAYLERAKAKLHFAEKMGFNNLEFCFDLVQAQEYHETEATKLLEEHCISECYGVQKAFIEPEIVFCADFSSKILTDLPKGSANLSNLVKLNLFNNKLTNLGLGFIHLKSLVLLDLSSNKIETISPIIGQLVHLNELNINKNDLTNIPDEIEKLVHLQKLYLRENNISEISSAIGKCSELQEMDLSLNKLTSLPAEIGNLKKLKVLNLVGNQFDKKSKKVIITLLPKTEVYF